MDTYDKLNMTMLCDFYELTMSNGYFRNSMRDRICYFDVFYRNVPDGGGFAIAAGPATPRSSTTDFTVSSPLPSRSTVRSARLLPFTATMSAPPIPLRVSAP